MHFKKTPGRVVAALIAMAWAAPLCGAFAAGDNGSAAVAAAQAAAEKALASPSEWIGPTSSPKPQLGKKLAIISCAQLSEGCNRPSRAALDAAQKIGWTATVFDGQADTGKQIAAINAAVDGKYDAILLSSCRPNPNQRRRSASYRRKHSARYSRGARLHRREKSAFGEDPRHIPRLVQDWRADRRLYDLEIGRTNSMRCC